MHDVNVWSNNCCKENNNNPKASPIYTWPTL